MTQCVRLVSLAVGGLVALVPALGWAAGDVIAYNRGGSLVIVGDPDENDITITPGFASDEFVVTGFNGTTVNFSVNPQTFAQIIGNLNVDMEEGNDSLIIQNVPIPSRLLMKLGDGNDTCEVTDSTVVGNVSMKAGDGLDLVTFTNLVIGGTVTMKGEDEDDTTVLDQVTMNRNAKFSGGDGDDELSIIGGSAVAGSLKVASDRGFDEVNLQNSVFTNVVKVSLGSENDDVALGGVTMNSQVRLDGGAGIDTYTDDGGNTFNGGVPTLIKIEIVN